MTAVLPRRAVLAASGAGLLELARSGVAMARPSPPAPTPWRNLFNGRDLTGWSLYQQDSAAGDPHGAVRVENGVLHLLGPSFQGPDRAAFGHIATEDEHRDYHLHLEYRWGERRFAPRRLQRRNSGILYHLGPDRDRLFPDGIEFQVEEGDVGDAITINTRARQGPLLGGTPLWPNWLPFLPQAYEPPIKAGNIARQWFRHSGPYERLDGWNQLDLLAFDDQAAHLVNGRIVTTLFGLVDRSDQPLTKGRIALEFEAAEVFFRRIAIRSRPSAAAASRCCSPAARRP